MIDLNALTLPELYAHLRQGGLIARLFELARDEDLAPGGGSTAFLNGDVTTLATVVSEAKRGSARIVARRPGTLAGLSAVDDILHAFRADVDFTPSASDGALATAGQCVGVLKGNLRAILSVERTLLNTLGRLCGIATRTAEFAAVVKGTRAGVFDTRKTTPGMRVLEKYAVRCGGGFCHRLGLFDAALIKDNHLEGVPMADLAGFVRRAVGRAHDESGPEGLRFIEVEVDRLDQLKAILDAGGCGVGIILLDNMHPAELRQAVALRAACKVKIELEASGGITLENLREIAQTGVDRISMGTLTHGATWLDLALDVDP